MRLVNVDDARELLIRRMKKLINSSRFDEFDELWISDTLDELPTVCDIPDNATNGDMTKAMFDVEEYHLKTEPNDVALRFKGEEKTIWFTLDWWNAPYQKGGKENK